MEPIMKRGFRYQTGEIKDIAEDLKNGKIPEVDVDNEEEFLGVINDLKAFDVLHAEDIEADHNAVDRAEKPEFQYRAAFYIGKDKNEVGYADFYTIDPPEKTYADAFGD